VWLGVSWRCQMEEKERIAVQDAVNACARLALWLAGELEPVDNDVVEQDLDAVYGLLVSAERLARKRSG